MSEMSDADYWRIEAKLADVERERDEARAEVAALLELFTSKHGSQLLTAWRGDVDVTNEVADILAGGRVAAGGELPSGADTDTQTHTTR